MALQEKDVKMLKILLVVAILAGAYYIYSEVLPMFDVVKNEIDGYNTKIKRARSEYKNLDRIRHEVLTLESELKELRKFFPEDNEQKTKTYELLTKLETLGKKLGVAFKELKFGNEIQYNDGLYKEIEMILVPKKELTMKKIIKLLYSFDKYENILDVKEFYLKPTNASKSLFEVKLTVSFYMFRSDTFKTKN
jgi:Tfp pilus assembly protein PilO